MSRVDWLDQNSFRIQLATSFVILGGYAVALAWHGWIGFGIACAGLAAFITPSFATAVVVVRDIRSRR